TIGCIPVPISESRHFGVVKVDANDRVERFIEKPQRAEPLPDEPQHFLASMGIYVFTAGPMFELLCEDAARTDSEHDFGKDIIPRMIGSQKVYAYRFRDQNRKAVPYWRDVGTLAAC